MTNITCTRLIQFDAAHRVMNHESKCKNLHGHRYVLEITVTAKDLDNLGRVIDFGVIKEVVGKWIDDNFDHNVILHQADRNLGEAISENTTQNIYYLPYNPTAENIAKYLLEEICPKLLAFSDVRVKSIKLYETPNCYAIVE